MKKLIFIIEQYLNDIGITPANGNNDEKVPNHSKSPTQIALEASNCKLDEAMMVIDDYLNAGSKEARASVSGRAKKLYEDYYGVPYVNRSDRNK